MSSYLLVPELLPDPTTCRIWAGIPFLNATPAPPAHAQLEDPQTGRAWPISGWDEWLVPDNSAGLLFSRTPIDGLTPRSRRRIDLRVDGEIVASAMASTLPDRLPAVDEPPLVLLLGSCFCAAQDKSGRAGAAYVRLPPALRPDLKILCGDQVYLDSPFYQFLVPHTRQRLAEIFLANYANTWGQDGDRQGFERLLADGSNVFTSDDHEFWNNAPFPSFSVNTYRRQDREAWWALASGLYSAVQTPASDDVVRRFDAGDLSILVADTRIARSDDRTTLLPPKDMAKVAAWIQGLKAPGVFVIGQPLFDKKSGWSGHIKDWNLPDFDQYGELCRALLDSPQPILMLTGDVHYGRVSTAVTHRGVELIELIASPMSLVTGGGTPKWEPPPALFPSEPIPGAAQIAITPLATWGRARNHFVTVELWQNGGRLCFRVRSWETQPDTGTPPGPVFEHALQRSL
jgi:hypothetical protein